MKVLLPHCQSIISSNLSRNITEQYLSKVHPKNKFSMFDQHVFTPNWNFWRFFFKRGSQKCSQPHFTHRLPHLILPPASSCIPTMSFQVHSLSISYSISAESRYYVVIVVDEKTTRLMSVEKMPMSHPCMDMKKNLHIPYLTIKDSTKCRF